MPSTTKIARTTACATRNGGSVWVGARACTAGIFMEELDNADEHVQIKRHQRGGDIDPAPGAGEPEQIKAHDRDRQQAEGEDAHRARRIEGMRASGKPVTLVKMARMTQAVHARIGPSPVSASLSCGALGENVKFEKRHINPPMIFETIHEVIASDSRRSSPIRHRILTQRCSRVAGLDKHEIGRTPICDTAGGLRSATGAGAFLSPEELPCAVSALLASRHMTAAAFAVIAQYSIPSGGRCGQSRDVSSLDE